MKIEKLGTNKNVGAVLLLGEPPLLPLCAVRVALADFLRLHQRAQVFVRELRYLYASSGICTLMGKILICPQSFIRIRKFSHGSRSSSDTLVVGTLLQRLKAFLK